MSTSSDNQKPICTRTSFLLSSKSASIKNHSTRKTQGLSENLGSILQSPCKKARCNGTWLCKPRPGEAMPLHPHPPQGLADQLFSQNWWAPGSGRDPVSKNQEQSNWERALTVTHTGTGMHSHGPALTCGSGFSYIHKTLQKEYIKTNCNTDHL